MARTDRPAEAAAGAGVTPVEELTSAHGGVAAKPPVRERYRLEWRHRSKGLDGRVLEVTRARAAADARTLRELVATHAPEAVRAEFMISLADVGGPERAVCVRAEELAAWAPVDGALPAGVVETWWREDEEAGLQRHRIFAGIVAAFDEARSLRLVGRRESRAMVERTRRLLLRV